MKKVTNLLIVAFHLLGALSFAQGTLTGKVIDGEMNAPLPGVNVVVVGSSQGASTDFDGNFSITVTEGVGLLRISYVGFATQTVPFTFANGATVNLGTISLSLDADALGEIVVIGSGVIDLGEDRQTPIAVSTITQSEIQEKAVGNVEFPEVMKNTPSVYVSNQSGGFGDSQMFLRGFSQNNTAFLLNGQPINGMEDGNMYWSNWAGISDVANAVQIQRGLGSSKLAISSVGGTVNIVSKATGRKEGGFARFMVGNDSYIKGTVSYDTGMSEKGWGFSFLLDHWQAANKYAQGTKGQGQNYFFSVGKKAGDHNFNFLIVGSPQWHDQNFSKGLDQYDQYGIKYNNNHGFYEDGEYLTSRRNYYHKPVMNLNWDWNVSEKSTWSTVLYGSFGRGGGTGTYGNGPSYIDGATDGAGHYNWSVVEDYNAGIAGGISSGYNGSMLRASVNNHAWYGAVSNYEYDTLEDWTFNVGADVRLYKGDHFRELTNLFGLNGRIENNGQRTDGYIVSATFDPNPWSALFDYADQDERIAYDYSEWINYQGIFAQAEYAHEGFSAFVQAAGSNQSYQREDRWNLPTTQKSDKINKGGYNIKGGASYALTEEHKIFVNAGQYSRQPYLDNVFSGSGDEITPANPEVDNEEVLGLEAGYKYETAVFQLNLNAYYTKWENRFLSAAGANYDMGNDGTIDYAEVYYEFSNITQLHKGLELDVKYKPTTILMLRGYASVGDWKYDGSTPVRVKNQDDFQYVDNITANLTDTKVGLAPQTALGFGAVYDFTPTFSVDVDFNHYANLYGFVDVEDVGLASVAGESYQSEELDSYSLVDMGASYKFTFGDQKMQLRANIYNLLDNEYISQSDAYGYFYGNGMTWNFSVKYSF